MKKFIEENQEALEALASAIKELDSIRGVKNERELLGRQYAIEIIDGWLNEIFSINTSDLKPLGETNDLNILKYQSKVEPDM